MYPTGSKNDRRGFDSRTQLCETRALKALLETRSQSLEDGTLPMLSLYAGNHVRDCDRVARRDFIRAGALGVGSLSLGGLTLPGLLSTRAAAAAANVADYVKDKSVVLLFLAGGPSQYETFDPKMDAPAEIRGKSGELQTSVPGLTFSGMFPNLAKIAHKFVIVQSFTGDGGAHESATVKLLTGGTARPTELEFGDEGASMGSYYSKIAGTNHPRTGIPMYSLLMEREIDEFYINYFLKAAVMASGPGQLGSIYTPFSPNRESVAQENMKLAIPAVRMSQRRALLDALDSLNREVDSRGFMTGLDKFHQQAFDVIRGDAFKALDIEQEDPKVVARYDTSHMRVYGHKKPEMWGPSTIGKLMLMARRLCEAGAGFVTVASSGWDMHGDINNLKTVRGMQIIAPPVDRAVAAFIEDIEARGLSDKILLVVTGEFGRSPKMNQFAGRDHWKGSCPLLLYGGGLKMGQVIGQSTRDGTQPATEPFDAENLMATIMHTLFDVGKLRLQDGLPQELRHVLDRGEPIPQLF